jgi:hypothetical protein
LFLHVQGGDYYESLIDGRIGELSTWYQDFESLYGLDWAITGLVGMVGKSIEME